KVFGKKMRCRVVDNAARGNCMFLAVLGNLGVAQTRENVLDLRNAVADFLATNLDRFADRLRSFQAEGDGDLTRAGLLARVESIRSYGCWADHIELCGLSELLNIHLTV